MLSDPFIQAFFQKNLAIDIAIASPNLRPVIARGLAVKKRDDHLIIFIDALLGQQLISSIQTMQMMTSTFCWPATEEAIQIKGHFLGFVKITDLDIALVQQRCNGFVNDVSQEGYDRSILEAYKYFTPTQLFALQMQPTQLFIQTPGAHAGNCISTGKTPE